MPGTQATCFHEADPALALYRRSGVEFVGTLFLMLAASGAGAAASRAFASSPGAALPIVALAVSAALVGLIVAFGSVSGGHFNPLITGLQWLAGERTGRCTAAYISGQLAGGLAGGWLARCLWKMSAPMAGGLAWSGVGAEFVASAGLMLVVFGCARNGRADTGPFAVGAWLVAAVMALPTTSYANPAIVAGALVTAGPVALGSGSALPYVLAEVLGALFALLIVFLTFPPHEVPA